MRKSFFLTSGAAVIGQPMIWLGDAKIQLGEPLFTVMTLLMIFLLVAGVILWILEPLLDRKPRP